MEVQRREALGAVRRAVRAYMHDPSLAHAGQVETAWRRLRQLDSVARWRHGSVGEPPHRLRRAGPQASSVVSETPSAARRVSHGLGR